MRVPHYGFVWWTGCEKWHYPLEEPSRRGDLVECEIRIPDVGWVSWSGDGAPKIKLADLCQECERRRVLRYAEAKLRRDLAMDRPTIHGGHNLEG